MIYAFFNMMMSMVFAKFVLNDVPHLVGLIGSADPSIQGWNSLSTLARSRGIEVYRILYAAGQGVVAIDAESLLGYKRLLGGYYLISTKTASDSDIDRLFNYLKAGIAWGKIEATKVNPTYTSFEHALREERKSSGLSEDMPPHMPVPGEGDYLEMLQGIDYVDSLFSKAITYQDKVIAIDSAMYIIHSTQGILQWILPLGYNELMAFFIVDILDLLAGRELHYWSNEMAVEELHRV